MENSRFTFTRENMRKIGISMIICIAAFCMLVAIEYFFPGLLPVEHKKTAVGIMGTFVVATLREFLLDR